MRHGLIVPALLGFVLAGPALAQSDPYRQAPSALFHGNYCGPGNNAPAPPIDALDAACARHDACSPNSGPATKACNLRLQRDAEAISRDPRQPNDLRTIAGFVSMGASMMMSTGVPHAGIPVGRTSNRKLHAADHRPEFGAVRRSSDKVSDARSHQGPFSSVRRKSANARAEGFMA